MHMERKHLELEREPTGAARRWWLVADGEGARLLETAKHERHPTLIRHIEHPEGRSKKGGSPPGRSFDSYGKSHQRHAMEPGMTPHEASIETFARELAKILGECRAEGLFEQLVLVAEPRFLGRVLHHLDEPTARTIVARIEKDLKNTSDRELPARLEAEGVI